MARTTCDKVGTSYRRFNDWLRGEMHRRGMRQDDLAEYLGCARSTLGFRLNGRIEWSFRDVLKVLDLLDARIEDII